MSGELLGAVRHRDFSVLTGSIEDVLADLGVTAFFFVNFRESLGELGLFVLVDDRGVGVVGRGIEEYGRFRFAEILVVSLGMSIAGGRLEGERSEASCTECTGSSDSRWASSFPISGDSDSSSSSNPCDSSWPDGAKESAGADPGSIAGACSSTLGDSVSAPQASWRIVSPVSFAGVSKAGVAGSVDDAAGRWVVCPGTRSLYFARDSPGRMIGS